MSDATPAMKSCSRKTCGQQNPQPVSEFFRDKSRADGLTNCCKGCSRETSRRWAQANPGKAAAKQGRYRRAHPERVAQANAAYLREHPELRARKTAAMRDFREADRDHDRAIRRPHNLTYRFGISIQRYDRMLAAQDGVCAMCRLPETVARSNGQVQPLAVDHDHACCAGRRSCGKCVRQLLCLRCNLELGLRERRELRMRMAGVDAASLTEGEWVLF